jgi:hypothetical protein
MLQQLFDTVNWHAGCEYRVNADPWFVPLRVGFLSNQTPYKDKLFKNNYLGGQVSEQGWSFGFGLNYKKYILDFSFVKRSLENGWWMMSSDYYNQRMFTTKNHYNEIFLSFACKL